MKDCFKFFLFCFKISEDRTNSDSEEMKHMQKSFDSGKNLGSFDEPDIEKLPESEILDIKPQVDQLKPGRNNRPSIILSMDGSERQLILFNTSANPPKEKNQSTNKHRRKKDKKKKKSKPIKLVNEDVVL